MCVQAWGVTGPPLKTLFSWLGFRWSAPLLPPVMESNARTTAVWSCLGRCRTAIPQHRGSAAGPNLHRAVPVQAAPARGWLASYAVPQSARHKGDAAACLQCQCEGGERDAGPLLHRAHAGCLGTPHAAHAAAVVRAYGSASVGVADRVRAKCGVKAVPGDVAPQGLLQLPRYSLFRVGGVLTVELG